MNPRSLSLAIECLLMVSLLVLILSSFITPIRASPFPVLINNGAVYTNSPTVTLTLNVSEVFANATLPEMSLNNTDSTNWTNWETYTPSKNWTLTSGDGFKTVYVMFRIVTGNLPSPPAAHLPPVPIYATSIVYAADITLDTTPPDLAITGPSANGTTVKSQTQRIDWTATDTGSGINHIEALLPNGNWINVGADTTYTLNDLSNGYYTFGVTAFDNAGNAANAIVSFSVDIPTTPTPPPTAGPGISLPPWWPIAVVVGVIVIVGTVAAVRRPRPKPEPPKTEETKPEEPKKEEEEREPYRKIQRLARYHFLMKYVPGIFYEGDLDFLEGRQHFQIGLTQDGTPTAEIFWEGGEGYGRQEDSTAWMRLGGTQLPDLQQLALEQLLKHRSIANVRVEGESWVVWFRRDSFSSPNDIENWMRRNFGEPLNEKALAFLEHVNRLAHKTDVQITIAISRQSHQIERFDLNFQAEDFNYRFTVTFNPLIGEVPKLPVGARAASVPEVRVLPEMLLMHIPTIGGWGFNCEHGPWAQRSIQLIEEKDAKEQKYAEIYHPDFQKKSFPTVPSFDQSRIDEVKPDPPDPPGQPWHPIVLGVNFEDSTGYSPAGSPPDTKVTRTMPPFYDQWFAADPVIVKYCQNPPYFRAFHHYGAEGEGLEHAWWMGLVKFQEKGTPMPTPTCKNAAGNYSWYSARDWGYGPPRVIENLNLMTFRRAIEQYHKYTLEGKRNAYLMLGHVLHLLQDQSEPDHLLLFAHNASDMNEPEAYSTFMYCEAIAAQVALATGCPAAALGAYVACKESAHSNWVGYERFARDKWRLDRVEGEIKAAGVVRKPDYDAFFQAISQNTENALNQAKKDHPSVYFGLPLGCGPLTYTVGVTIPGNDPNINLNDPEQVQAFMDLTDKLAPQAIGLSAGLIEHFFDIVNYPPFVERVVIVQFDEGAQPLEFGMLSHDPTHHCVRYDVEWQWKQQQNVRVRVENKVQQLSPDRPAYVFVLFGPTDVGPIHKGKTMEKVELHVKDQYWEVEGKPLDLLVEMQPADDQMCGPYWWGCFHIVNCGNDARTVTLEITGKDLGPHYADRKEHGDVLDANPANIATVDIFSPSFEWVNYRPGADCNHTVKIPPMTSKLNTSPLPLIIAQKLGSKGTVDLTLLQKAWDCRWISEDFYCPMQCKVEWALDKQVKKTKGGAVQMGAPGDFGLGVAFVRHMGSASLTVTVQERCMTGKYDFEVRYKVGVPLVEYKVMVPVEIINAP